MRIVRAVSSDLRALEYFRWPGSPQRSGSELAWQAPENNTLALHIVVVRDGDQVIDTGARRARLNEVFEDGASVTVTLHRRPLIAWLVALVT